MITILIFSLIIYTNALSPQIQNDTEREIQSILNKYLDKIPDIDTKYVLNEGLSKSISKYFKGRISALPLFKISLKIDRTPVRIPWVLGSPGDQPPPAPPDASAASPAARGPAAHPHAKQYHIRIDKDQMGDTKQN